MNEKKRTWADVYDEMCRVVNNESYPDLDICFLRGIINVPARNDDMRHYSQEVYM